MKRVQLRKLEAYGFKSFADKLEMEFGGGITAIVGPNGSGKSNITDAIRWVLGEQNVRNLRAAKTEEIIFSGSSTRRALGAAEVSLTFDNSDGKLPLDFQEVVVTRRLFRSGESEFYINKARCRLKDIHDLLADTGLGKDAISVISQNKIDQVLNSRPEERRLLFEETAGITKYRNRKRESLRKLEDTEQNVRRVADILAELERQLGPMEEQAERTRRYNALYEVYRRCKVTLLADQYEAQRRLRENCEKQKADAARESREHEVQTQLAEVEKERLGNELLEVEKSLRLLTDKNRALHETLEKNQGDLAVLRERLRQGEETKERLRLTRCRLRESMERAGEDRVAAERQLAQAAAKADRVRTAARAAAAEDAALLEEIAALETALGERKLESFAQTRALLEYKNEAELRRREIETRAEELAAAQEELGALRDAARGKAAERAELLFQVDAAEKAFAQAEAAKRAREAARAAAALRRDETAAQTRQLEQEGGAIKTRLQILRGMQAEYEGFGRAVKRVLKNDLPWHRGVCGAVAEVVSMEPRYATAIEIALGASLQHVIVESDAVAKQAIACLKREKLGRVTFLPLNTMVAPPPRRLDAVVAQAPGFLGCAGDLVQCGEKYRKIVDALLGRTLVVDHIDTAAELARRLGYRMRIVTLEGEMLHPGGSLSGGGAARREASFLNRAGEIAALEERLAARDRLLAEANAAAAAAAAAAERAAAALREQAEAMQRLTVRQAQQKIYLEQAAQEEKALALSLEKIEEKAARSVAKRREAAAAQEAAEREIARLEQAAAAREQGDQTAETRLAERRGARDVAAQSAVERRIAQTVAEQEMLRVEDRLAALALAAQSDAAELERLDKEARDCDAAMERRQQRQAALGGEIERFKELKAVGAKDYDHYYQVKLGKLAKIQEHDQQLRDLRRMYHELQGKLHQMDISYTKYAYETERCEKILREEYGLSASEALASRLGEDAAALRQRSEEVGREMRALGSVNPNAIAEYESVRSRYDFMKKQADDLIVAKDYLMGIIQEIDATMSKQFKAAFAEISVYFSEIFARLFGGGEAKLELGDAENVLEAGIEISVRPPGKKLQSLSVLSGGERALTVIALLFSFLRYRPAPFSVVDEIDAPLDEANVERFGAFLREYAGHTQFIVVTHRKGTMQAADVMHGVTVEDSGVSKIISVRLEEALDGQAEA